MVESKNDFEDALKRLAKLTEEEAKMASAEVFKSTRRLDDSVETVISDGIQSEFFSHTYCPDALYRQMTRRQEQVSTKKSVRHFYSYRAS